MEETLNELLEKEAESLTQAARYERIEARQGYRSGHYDRNLTTISGDVTLHMSSFLLFSICATYCTLSKGKTSGCRVVSRFMRKFDSGIWQKSITGGLRRPRGYVWAVGAQRVKGGGSRLSCP